MDKKCVEVIDDHMKSREEYLNELYEKRDSEDTEVSDEAFDELLDFGLSVETKKVLKYTFSTGGPADWIEVIYSVNGRGYSDVESVTYHFADWFDHASVYVPKDSPLYQLAYETIESIES